MSMDATITQGAVEHAFPARGGAAERLRFLLQWAVLAPSRHNTQPWTFEIEGDELRAYADPTRSLPVADPDGRQLVMSCGAALVNLRLAAAHFGHATSLEVLAGHRRDGLLARVRLEERSASTPETEEMFRAIPRRRTNRLPLDGRDPPEGLVTSLLREAPELAGWTRTNSSTRRDGLPGFALGMSDVAAFLQPLLVRMQSRARAEADRDRRRALGSKVLLVLSTQGDGVAEWVRAGVALQRVLLRATAAGLFASYFSQPIETPALRSRLADVIGDRGAPQVMFRLGYGLEPRAMPRRPVEGILRRMEPGVRRPEPLALRAVPAAAEERAREPRVAPELPEPHLVPPPRPDGVEVTLR